MYPHYAAGAAIGLFAGFLCLWLWPRTGPRPLAGARLSASPVRRRIASIYLGGAVAAASIGTAAGGAALWLWWIAAALALVAAIYAVTGAAGFQKRNGSHSLAVTVLAAPYLVAARLLPVWRSRKCPAPSAIRDGVWLGRLPFAREMARWGGGDGICSALGFDRGAVHRARRLALCLDAVARPGGARARSPSRRGPRNRTLAAGGRAGAGVLRHGPRAQRDCGCGLAAVSPGGRKMPPMPSPRCGPAARRWCSGPRTGRRSPNASGCGGRRRRPLGGQYLRPRFRLWEREKPPCGDRLTFGICEVF